MHHQYTHNANTCNVPVLPVVGISVTMDDAFTVGIGVNLVGAMDDVVAIGEVVDGATIAVTDTGADEKGKLVSVNNRALIILLHNNDCLVQSNRVFCKLKYSSKLVHCLVKAFH